MSNNLKGMSCRTPRDQCVESRCISHNTSTICSSHSIMLTSVCTPEAAQKIGTLKYDHYALSTQAVIVLSSAPIGMLSTSCNTRAAAFRTSGRGRIRSNGDWCSGSLGACRVFVWRFWCGPKLVGACVGVVGIGIGIRGPRPKTFRARSTWGLPGAS